MDSMILRLRIENGQLLVTLLDKAGAVIAKSDAQSLSGLNVQEIHKTLAEEKNPSEKIPQIGRALGQLLLPKPVKEAWAALAGKGKFRTILDLDPTAAKIPWEMANVDGQLFLNQNLPFLRRAKAA